VTPSIGVRLTTYNRACDILLLEDILGSVRSSHGSCIGKGYASKRWSKTSGATLRRVKGNTGLGNPKIPVENTYLVESKRLMADSRIVGVIKVISTINDITRNTVLAGDSALTRILQRHLSSRRCKGT